jgi:2-succinyl-5-enolpyruvyl-6-hydroxy-3-cyclohexene-1-carboxylate synthase
VNATDTYVLLRAFVDELARCGMRAACTSPGSRSAPLALTLAREPRLRCYSHVDERCAGFFALGLAKASGLPVAVTCTSGTAVANLLPAAIEAHEARVPLLLLTADRPPELRENGAGQAIDQLKLFGGAAKWFFEVGTHEAAPERLRWIRTLACRAYATTLEGRPGVVHLNFPLREPLVTDEALPDDDTGRAGGEPYVRRVSLDASAQARADFGPIGAAIATAARGVVVAGRHERRSPPGEPSLGELAARFAAERGWPLLADPMSGARRGTAAIAHYDLLLSDTAFARSLDPDLILRVGDLPVSKPLRVWLGSRSDVRQVALDAEGAWQDPAAVVSDSVALDAATALRALPATVRSPDPEWLARWRRADERAGEAILGTLETDELSEPRVALELGALLPQDATLFVSSSMPVRDVETFWAARADQPRVLCNRGANGIDGVVSSAFGVAAADDGPVVLLIGDVALAHDIGGLLAARRLDLSLTIVVVNNSGGGIFDFLPIASVVEPGVYRQHITTPTGLCLEHVAELYGLGHERVRDVRAFRATLTRELAARGSSIIEIHTDRDANVALHESLRNAATLTSQSS